MKPFVKLNRGELSNDLLECHPNAFLLLSLIALRARRTPNLIKGLDICECQLGDYKACGLTEQKYRTAKKVLESLGLVTFYSTNKGTVAKINNSSIYDINVCEVNGPITGDQRTPNGRVTTNKNVKKEKNVKETPPSDDFDRFWNLYAKKKDTAKCKAKWKNISKKDKENIFETLHLYLEATPDKQYRKNPLTYLNGEIWKDDFTPEPEYNEDGNLVTPVEIDWDAIARVKVEAQKE